MSCAQPISEICYQAGWPTSATNGILFIATDYYGITQLTLQNDNPPDVLTALRVEHHPHRG